MAVVAFGRQLLLRAPAERVQPGPEHLSGPRPRRRKQRRAAYGALISPPPSALDLRRRRTGNTELVRRADLHGRVRVGAKCSELAPSDRSRTNARALGMAGAGRAFVRRRGRARIEEPPRAR